MASHSTWNPLQQFIDEIHLFITGQLPVKPSNLIKQNKDHLHENGEFSFSNKRKVWLSHMSSSRQEAAGFCVDVNCKHNETLFIDDTNDANSSKATTSTSTTTDDDDKNDGKTDCGKHDSHSHYTVTKLLSSNSFALHVARVKIVGDWCNVFLDRRKCYAEIFRKVLDNEKTKEKGQGCKSILITRDDDGKSIDGAQSVTDYRLQLLESVIKNLINQSDYWVLVQQSDEQKTTKPIRVHLTTKSSAIVASDTRKIVSGIVVDPKNGNKLAAVTTDDYVKKRSTDMQLMAQHKYGLRVRNEAVFVALIKQLGLAAVTVDFMEVRHSSPVGLNVSGCSTSKGASFILYNSARIETILRKFHERVACGYYNALPELSDIDISQLSEEEEWQMLIVYVAGYENLIDKSLADIENGRIAPHLVCNFLCGLVGLFSIYYRRCRILVENRSQLMPQLFARIYLIKCIQKTLNNALALLNIDPVTQM
ncbi:uncharacterized protein LOC134834417 [Culicoides brevitarsis]|uniref:uncharacterized protein LOC134834417 n=1 Tax=Culicoides brevitarsis TaxID=469753 RepID=UPI00307C155E